MLLYTGVPTGAKKSVPICVPVVAGLGAPNGDVNSYFLYSGAGGSFNADIGISGFQSGGLPIPINSLLYFGTV